MDDLNPFLISGEAGGNRPVAILFLYSPRQYGTQVLRPYIYAFSENAVDKLLGGGDTMSEDSNVQTLQVVKKSRPVSDRIPMGLI